MGKKKFIDKKKAATFQLFARDSSDPVYESGPGPSSDRVFVRVDNNTSYSINAFDDNVGDPDSIFADAPEDGGDWAGSTRTGLPDDVRKEIIELGFPDDGYNYLSHLREIKNSGGGSSYYENPKAKLTELPRDIKAYDASRVEVAKVIDDLNEKSVYNAAAKTVGVRVQKAVDPEVAALLDDSDLSRFGSDVEDLDEDFVIQANLPDGPVNVDLDENLSFAEKLGIEKVGRNDTAGLMRGNEAKFATFEEKPRERRLLDDQFDLLELQEYGSDTEDEHYGDMVEENECQESLEEKLNHAFKECAIDGLGLVNSGPDDGELLEPAADVINRCREYAEKYENESPAEDASVFSESSSDSEVWDCETIVSTYSTLDNHPGKIVVPAASRKKKLLPVISEASPIISLKGKAKLPVDYLPSKGKHSVQKEDTKNEGTEKEEKDNSKTEQLKRKQHGQESKEEKKERKAAVKEERREARRMKKEMKELYKSEGQRAQKVAAFTGPSAIHLM